MTADRKMSAAFHPHDGPVGEVPPEVSVLDVVSVQFQRDSARRQRDAALARADAAEARLRAVEGLVTGIPADVVKAQTDGVPISPRALYVNLRADLRAALQVEVR